MEKLLINLRNIRDGFNWVRSEGNQVFASTGERFSLSFEIEETSERRNIVQVQACMITNDIVVWRWGCENEDDTHAVLGMYRSIKSKAQINEINERAKLGEELLRKINIGAF